MHLHKRRQKTLERTRRRRRAGVLKNKKYFEKYLSLGSFAVVKV